MRLLSFLAVPLLALVLAACSDTTVDDGPTVPALSFLHAEPDPVEGGRIVDAHGREVLLRGANVNAYVEYWSGNDFPTTFPFTESDARRMSEIGWNAVRLLLSWSLVEPEPGVYDEAYIDQIESAVAILERHGLYSIIDLHQDAWSATLAARPDEVCEPPAEPALGWDGAPAWATLDGGAARCILNGTRETSPAVVSSWDSFFANEEGPGGVGLRTRYANMLGHLAERFANDPAVAGYDIMNEPGALSPPQQEGLSELYTEALAAIRAGENRAGGPPHLVLFEPSSLWSAIGVGPPIDFERDENVVYAPHIYTGGFSGTPITRDAFLIAVEEAAGFGGAPVLTGEWGADPNRAGPDGDGYFLSHQSLQDVFHVSATIWTWRESCGDPHKVSDARNGANPPVPWGEFEVDCFTNDILGERELLVNDLTRPYPRAAPGHLDSTIYETGTGRLQVRAVEAPIDTEVVVFYPAQKHGRPDVAQAGLRDVTITDGPGGSVYIRGWTTEPEWILDARQD